MDGLNEAIARLVSDGLGYLWFLLLAMWGGTVSYIRRLRADDDKTFSLAELLGEWSISGFSGLLIAYMCVSFELGWHVTAVASGIAGHMGGRSIRILEEWTLTVIDKFFPPSRPKGD